MMKKILLSWKKVLCTFIAATFILGILPAMPASAADTFTYGEMQQVTRAYEAGGKSFRLYKGAFRYAGYDDGVDSESLFYFSPGFFANDPTQYKPELATASAAMAFAGFFSNEGAPSTKRANIVQFLQTIGCDIKDIYSNVYNTIEPQTDSIGVTMGSMKLNEVEEGRILIPISIRGGNYGKEWASNVTLGKYEEVIDGEAKGFSTAATIVFSEIQNYIRTHDLVQKANEGKLTFWITGFSRAGATANITAKRLVDAYISKNNKVFAYSIEPAQGANIIKPEREKDYLCIHSIINKGDIVPLVAPSTMGFMRYGTDHYVPGSEAGKRIYATPTPTDNLPYEVGSAEYNTKHGHMIGQLKAVEPRRAFSDYFETRGLDLSKLRALGVSLLSTVAFVITVIVVTVQALKEKQEVVLQKGRKAQMGDFIRGVIEHTQEWTGLTRNGYSGAIEENQPYYGNIEMALRDYMSITRDSTPAQMSEFKKRVKGLWDNGEIGIMKLVTLFFNAFDRWNKLSAGEKEYYKGMFVDWLDKSKCFDALELTKAEKERVLKTDVPAMLDYAMAFASTDYHEDLYGTDGLTNILTMLRNIENIMLNHKPEIILAWLRAFDPLYEHDSEPIKVEYEAPSAPVLTYAGQEVADKAELSINPKKLGAPGNTLELTIPKEQLFGTKVGYEIKKGNETIVPSTLSDTWPVKIISIPSTEQGAEYELVYWSENTVRKTSAPVQKKSAKLKIEFTSVPVKVYSYDRSGNEKQTTYDMVPGQTIALKTDVPDGQFFVQWDIVYEFDNNSKMAETLEDEESVFKFKFGSNVRNSVRNVTVKPAFLDLPDDEEEEIAVDLPYPVDPATIGQDDSTKVKIVVPEEPSLPPTTEYIMSPVDKTISDDRQTLTITIPQKVKTWDNKEKTIKQKEVKLKPTETPKEIPSGNPDIALEQQRIEEKTIEAETFYEVVITIKKEETPKPQDRDITINCVNLVTGQTQQVVQKTYNDGGNIRVEAPVLNNLLFYRWEDLTDDTQYEPERTAPAEGNLTVYYLPVVEKMECTVDLPEEQVQTMRRAASAASLTSCALTMAGGETYGLTAEQLEQFTVIPGERENSEEEGMQSVPVMILPNDDSILSIFPFDPEFSVTVNGAEASYGSRINEAGEEEGLYILADILVPAPAPEPEPEKSTEISIIVNPDDITAEHGSELNAILPTEVLVQYTDGRTESLPITWNTEDAVWYMLMDQENASKKWVALDDVPTPNIADQVYCALTGDVQEPAGTTFVEETAGAGTVTLGVYIGGLPDAEMPWPTHFEGEYDVPLDLGLTSVDADGNDTGARIFYTLDGSNPKTSPTSMLYTGPVSLGKGISETTEYTVLAYAAGDYVNTDDSDIAYFTYTISPKEDQKEDAKPADKTSIDTGDPNHMTYWIIGMAAAVVLIAAAVIIFSVRRRNKK